MSHQEQPDLQSAKGLSTPVGSRRTFFHWVTVAAAGFVGVGLSIPLLSSFIAPAFMRRNATGWMSEPWTICPLGHPTQLDHVTTIRDGWMETKSHKAVWAVK